MKILTKSKFWSIILLLGYVVTAQQTYGIMCNNGQTKYLCVSVKRGLRYDMWISEVYWAFGGCKGCTPEEARKWPSECRYPVLTQQAKCIKLMADEYAQLIHNGKSGPFAALSYGIFEKVNDAIDEVGDAAIARAVEEVKYAGKSKAERAVGTASDKIGKVADKVVKKVTAEKSKAEGAVATTIDKIGNVAGQAVEKVTAEKSKAEGALATAIDKIGNVADQAVKKVADAVPRN